MSISQNFAIFRQLFFFYDLPYGGMYAMFTVNLHNIIKISKKSAFTLIEVMVSVAILSMIFTVVYSILYATVEAQQKIPNEIHIDRMADRLLGLIIRDIQSAYIYQVDGPCFVGKSAPQGDRLDLVTNTDSLLGSESVKSDLCEVGYYLIKHPKYSDEFILIRREDFFLDDKLQEGGFGIKLYDRLAKLKFEYIDADGKISPTWNDKENKSLPKAVHVILGFFTAPPGIEDLSLKKSSIREYQVYVPIVVSPKLPIPPKKNQAKKDEPK